MHVVHNFFLKIRRKFVLTTLVPEIALRTDLSSMWAIQSFGKQKFIDLETLHMKRGMMVLLLFSARIKNTETFCCYKNTPMIRENKHEKFAETQCCSMVLNKGLHEQPFTFSYK